MNFIIWLVVGGLIGWVASMIMRTDGQQGIFLNIIVGIVGAMLGGWLISPLVGVPTINQGSLSIGALVVSGRHHSAGDRQSLSPRYRALRACKV